MKIQPIETREAPAAIGPYSQAIAAGGFLFTAGQIPLHPQTGEIVGEDIKSQTQQVMKNLSAVLQAGGSGFAHVVKATVFLSTMDDFAGMNEIYSQYMGNARPARSAVAVVTLPKGVRVEIDLIAQKP